MKDRKIMRRCERNRVPNASQAEAKIAIVRVISQVQWR